jgi:hypothetical protein
MDMWGNDLYRRLHELAQRRWDGAISPAEHQELESLLLESDAARRVYTEYVQETACLRWGCQQETVDAVECTLAPSAGYGRVPIVRRARIAALLFGLAAAL